MAGRGHVVYYLLCQTERGVQVKIGTTGHLRQRIAAISADPYMVGFVKLLAIEPGSLAVEGKRHRQFAGSRAHREWFYPTPDLLMHIAAFQCSLDLWRDRIESSVQRRYRREEAAAARGEVVF